jgi:hypothetical protein
VPSMRIVSAVNNIFSCSIDENRSILCLLVMNLSMTKKFSPLSVFAKGSGISNNCVVGMLGVIARRALLMALSESEKALSQQQIGS